MLVELKGGQFVNQGAHLMLLAAREAIKRHHSDVAVAMRDSRLSSAEARKQFGALRKQPLRRRRLDISALAYYIPSFSRRLLLRAGIVLEPDVDLTLDLSGYAYGDPWGDHSMLATADEIARMTTHGRRYIFLPQAFGPFKEISLAVRRRFSSSLAKAGLVAVRDAKSLSHLQELPGFDDHNVSLFPDFTVALMPTADLEFLPEVDGKTLVIIPNIRVYERSSVIAGESVYLAVLQRLSAVARRANYRLAVLNHSIGEDDALCRSIAHSVSADVFIETADPLVNKRIIAGAGVVVSSRYHGCASALSMSVPCIGLGWSHKYAALFDDFDMHPWVRDLSEMSDAPHLLGQLLDSAQSVKSRLNATKQRVIARTELMWAQIFGV